MSSSFPPLKITIIGLGLIGPRHAQSILASSSCTLHSIIDPSPSTISLASTLKTTYYPSITSLLTSPNKPDAAIICTPNHTHVSFSLQLIGAGIHVLVEKPVSTSISDGIKLLRSAREKGVKVLVGHHRRFNSYVVAVKKALSEKKIGDILAIQGIWALQKPTTYFEGIGEWRRKAGVIDINLIHEIDLLQYLLGPIILVSALEGNKTRGFEAEECVAILLKFKNGVIGTFLLSDNTPSPWSFESGTGENPMIPRNDKNDEIGGFWRILGREGSLSVPEMTVWRGVWTEKLGREKVDVEEGRLPFDDQVEHFCEVVRGRAAPRCGVEEAVSAVVVCEAVRRAMRSGGWVGIEGLEIIDGIEKARL